MLSTGDHPDTPRGSSSSKDPVETDQEAAGAAGSAFGNINSPSTSIKSEIQSPTDSQFATSPRTTQSARSRRRQRKRENKRRSTADNKWSPGPSASEGILEAGLARAMADGMGSEGRIVEVEDAKDRGQEEDEAATHTQDDLNTAATPSNPALKDSPPPRVVEEETVDKVGGAGETDDDTVKPALPSAIPSSSRIAAAAVIPTDVASPTSNVTPVSSRDGLPSQQRARGATSGSTATTPQQREQRPRLPVPQESFTLSAEMTLLQTAHKNMFKPLVDRIEDERLWTDATGFRDARLRMLQDLKVIDMEQAEAYGPQFVNEFRLSLVGAQMSMERLQEIMIPVIEKLATDVLNLARAEFLRYIKNLIANVYSICVDLNQCMHGAGRRSAAPARGDSFEGMREISRRQSRDSTDSGPESVLDTRDSRHLLKAKPEQLIDKVLLLTKTVDEQKSQIAEYEETISALQKKTDKLECELPRARADLRLAERRHRLELDERQKEADIRVENARKAPVAPKDRPSRSREPAEKGDSNQNAMLAFPDPSKVPAILSTQADEQAQVEDHRREQEIILRKKYDAQMRRIVTSILEEEDLTKMYIDKVGSHVVHAVESRSDSISPQQPVAEAASRPSEVAELTKDQLLASLRTALDECAACRRQLVKYRAKSAKRHTIENLEFGERKRVLQVTQRALEVVDSHFDSLIKDSQYVYDFARVAVQVGRPDAGQQAYTKELRAVLDMSERLQKSRPQHYDPAILQGGQLDKLEVFQDLWLPQTQEFTTRSEEFLQAVVALRSKVQAHYAVAQRAEDQPKHGPRSLTAGFWTLFGSTGKQKTLPAAPHQHSESLHLHQNGPCEACKPVVEFPAGFVNDDADYGVRVGGTARVSFADGDPSITTKPSQGQSTRMLERKNRVVELVSTRLANADRVGTARNIPRTPYPSGTQKSIETQIRPPATQTSPTLSEHNISPAEHGERDSASNEGSLVAEQNLARGESAGNQKDDASTPASVVVGRQGSGRQYRRQKGGEENILVSNDGARVAFFICDRLITGASSPVRFWGAKVPASTGSSPRSEPLIRSISGPKASLQAFPHSPAAPSLSDSSIGSVPPIYPSEDTGQRKWRERGPRVQVAPGAQLPDKKDQPSNDAEGDVTSEDWQSAKEQREEMENDSGESSTRRASQPQTSPSQRSSSSSSSSSSWHSSNEQMPQHLAPLGFVPQFLQLLQTLLRFLTYGQIRNVQAILHYNYRVGWMTLWLPISDWMYAEEGPRRYKVLLMPREEMISLLLWCLVVMHFLGLVAMVEERRIWLDANARTAGYIRGLQHRSPYLFGWLCEVDYVLLGSAWKHLRAQLHDMMFRHGPGSMHDRQ
ncbi:hypothetical protein BD289DRAFT_111237 [Coniella lustricola]|uniref:Uncharacterized protein n=1 Tax=Coniella lustricola TaxID=2025994 RepID=A0A2T2ZX71_9PEZI|nr:hypothetical protein BD289DRAFT_111237 [Coniella lustricola]